MHPQHFLLINDLAAGDETSMRDAFERLAAAARHRGARPTDTFYSLPRRRAYTFIEADGEQTIRDLALAAGLAVADVLPAEHMYTGILDEPNRAR